MVRFHPTRTGGSARGLVRTRGRPEPGTGGWPPWLAVAILLLSAAPGGQARAAGMAAPPVVYSAAVDAIIHPISAEYMIETLERADAAGAELVIFTLRTPGGLLDSTRTIVQRIITARTPVAVFVGPAGARAASAGFFLILAADVAIMAPGTHIGAAHPVSGSGERLDETMSKKAAADAAAYIRTLAGNRHRNVALAEAAVKESRAFTEEEARSASPPLIDLVAPTVAAALTALDGRTIRRFDGRPTVLHTRGAAVVTLEMTWRQRILSAVAHPNVAYILLSLGTLGLTIELWSPGAILPGVAGGLCLLLAFFAFQILPVNYAGLLLILFGLLLLVLELKVQSFGLLTIGGLLSLVFGSLILMDTTAPELQLNRGLILGLSLGLTTIIAFLVRLAVRSQRHQPVTGEAGMIGEIGRALTVIAPARTGHVAVHGEIWTATTREPEPIAPDEPIRVTAVHGLTLTVERSVSSSGSTERNLL